MAVCGVDDRVDLLRGEVPLENLERQWWSAERDHGWRGG
jgi:hypothetical protein